MSKTASKEKSPKSAADVRADGYKRNMEYVESFKGSHHCKRCLNTFPARVMEFATPPKGVWSISRLAGSRCNLSVLTKAMCEAQLLCSNCKRIVEGKE